MFYFTCNYDLKSRKNHRHELVLFIICLLFDYASPTVFSLPHPPAVGCQLKQMSDRETLKEIKGKPGDTYSHKNAVRLMSAQLDPHCRHGRLRTFSTETQVCGVR